jgi:hypothetical protein
MGEYYGLDWIAAVLTFAAIWLLGNHNRWGFVLMIGGNGFWIATALLAGSYGMIAANAGFIVLNIRGLWRWSRQDSPGRQDQP